MKTHSKASYSGKLIKTNRFFFPNLVTSVHETDYFLFSYQAFCSLKHYNLLYAGSFVIRKLNQTTSCLTLQFKGENALKPPFNSIFN